VTAMRPDLQKHLAWLETPSCRCPHAWLALGILYGVSFGHGWVRTDTNPECQYHGASAARLAAGA
jgi:hypothetical protein